MDLIQTFFNYDIATQSAPLLFNGLIMTITLGFASAIITFILGIILGMLRLYGPWPVRVLVVAYIDIFRAFPMLVLLMVVYYALPFVGIRMSSFMAAATALSLISSAYAAEIIRAGLEAIPKGQFEAAFALGLPWWRTMLDVIVPQAMRIVLPPATGIAVALTKDTALASVVAMPDLLKQATQAQAFYANPTPLIAAAGLYLLILIPLVRVVAILEAKSSR